MSAAGWTRSPSQPGKICRNALKKSLNGQVPKLGLTLGNSANFCPLTRIHSLLTELGQFCPIGCPNRGSSASENGAAAMDLDKLTLFKMALTKMDWASQRQKVLAQNVANAD